VAAVMAYDRAINRRAEPHYFYSPGDPPTPRQERSFEDERDRLAHFFGDDDEDDDW
jgi:hypothetical protein